MTQNLLQTQHLSFSAISSSLLSSDESINANGAKYFSEEANPGSEVESPAWFSLFMFWVWFFFFLFCDFVTHISHLLEIFGFFIIHSCNFSFFFRRCHLPLQLFLLMHDWYFTLFLYNFNFLVNFSTSLHEKVSNLIFCSFINGLSPVQYAVWYLKLVVWTKLKCHLWNTKSKNWYNMIFIDLDKV